ncbi:Folylpolyglutamate synthetase [Coemansia guatemalensis]|uniref:Folylpolyglutamate synthase n=1 Tax=Coemansia guatemalensis TaxID=2761395 RepID=A0A9W8I0V9_9FUNG|nr:Folylpolyglutamate synthetase [Coemansia guatemalensis]
MPPPATATAPTECIDSRTYESAVHDLNSLQSNYQTLQQIKESGGQLNEYSLPEFEAFIEKTGHTVTDLNRLNVIHITGTKGKGSTCAFVDSVLRQTGKLKVGLYTSPHLIEVRERIRINGEPLSREAFGKYFYQVYDKIRASKPELRKVHEGSPDMPMYFRFLTLMAFHAFLAEGVDVAVVEVGVGGQYDSTNVIRQPVVCGIASLGLDHQAALGATIDQIAWHKAGIIKPRVPVFTVSQPHDALNVIRQRAEKCSAPLQVVTPLPDTQELGIPGIHQRTNAALASALCHTFSQRTGHVISATCIADGLRLAQWPGRSQRFVSPRNPKLTWFVDGAHTIESISACAQWFASLDHPSRCLLLFNPAKGRESKELLATLLEVTGECQWIGAVFCPNVSVSRADSINKNMPEDADLAIQHDAAQVWESLQPSSSAPAAAKHIVPSINRAVELIESKYADAPLHVLVTGSMHLVGGVLDIAKGSI